MKPFTYTIKDGPGIQARPACLLAGAYGNAAVTASKRRLPLGRRLFSDE